MRRAFPWLFTTFSGAFLLFLVVQIVVLVPGVRVSLNRYEQTQSTEFETIARRILIDPEVEQEETLRYTNPFFVFSADGNLLYTNRGRGRSIPPADLLPVEYDNVKIGSYYAGEMRFLDNEANRIFLITLTILAAVSLVISVALGVLVSLFASRRFARPLRILQSDIRSIESRTAVKARPFSITEVCDISSSLEKLSTMLADEERYKRQWMQDIAHDLRTPVSGLRSQIEGMRDGVLEVQTDRFDRNLAEIERLEGLIEGIATLYNVENMQIFEPERFFTEGFVTELLSSYEVATQRKKMNVTVDIQVKTLAGDRALLLRAVNNIVANAFLYAPEDGAIRIEVYPARSNIELSVLDDGPGIPPDNLDKIFNRFYRGEYSRSTTGTGLGLNIAKTIVELHSGTLIAKNREPNGAAFIISLPA
jgi:signal transduction histidine kinase